MFFLFNAAVHCRWWFEACNISIFYGFFVKNWLIPSPKELVTHCLPNVQHVENARETSTSPVKFFYIFLSTNALAGTTCRKCLLQTVQTKVLSFPVNILTTLIVQFVRNFYLLATFTKRKQSDFCRRFERSSLGADAILRFLYNPKAFINNRILQTIRVFVIHCLILLISNEKNWLFVQN
jgi:hypothetical protein